MSTVQIWQCLYLGSFGFIFVSWKELEMCFPSLYMRQDRRTIWYYCVEALLQHKSTPKSTEAVKLFWLSNKTNLLCIQIHLVRQSRNNYNIWTVRAKYFKEMISKGKIALPGRRCTSSSHEPGCEQTHHISENAGANFQIRIIWTHSLTVLWTQDDPLHLTGSSGFGHTRNAIATSTDRVLRKFK